MQLLHNLTTDGMRVLMLGLLLIAGIALGCVLAWPTGDGEEELK